jgi:hypothetical protein
MSSIYLMQYAPPYARASRRISLNIARTTSSSVGKQGARDF